MKKRFRIILLAAVMLIGMMSLSAFAEVGTAGKYIDANGDEQDIPEAAAITADSTLLMPGWYTVSGRVEIDERISLSGGAVYIVLMDGSDLIINGGIGLNGAGTLLTIYAQPAGTGKLTANGIENYASGIGSNADGSCGDITINGGIITVTGGQGSAGIGSGPRGNCGNIVINGGTVTVTGGQGGAGIGSGDGGSCSNIRVNEGTVTATGGTRGAGIGTGDGGSCVYIEIAGGNVTATGGNSGAGIGSGNSGSNGPLQIRSGIVTANGGKGAAGIGSGFGRNGGAASVHGVTILGGIVTAIGDAEDVAIGSGIGCGIGSGSEGSTCSFVDLIGGYVTAIGGYYAAGIGSSAFASCGDIKITNAYVMADAIGSCADIGSGTGGSCGSVNCESEYTSEYEGARYINYAAFDGKNPTCTESGYKPYYEELKTEKLYLDIPFTEATLITDLETDLAAYREKGAGGYLPTIIHDEFGPGYCRRCNSKFADVFAESDPSCTEDGHIEYYKSYDDSLYYTAYPFTEESLIGDGDDLAVWLAEGGEGFTAARFGHYDDESNLDGVCERCHRQYYEFVAGRVPTNCEEVGHLPYYKLLNTAEYYTAYPFDETSFIGDETAFTAWLNEGDGYIAPLKHDDRDGDGICEYCKKLFYERTGRLEPTCTESGHKAYYKQLEENQYYSAFPFDEYRRIGDEDNILFWLTWGGGHIAPLGHLDKDNDGVCDRCKAVLYRYYDYDRNNGQMTEQIQSAAVIDTSTETMTLTEGWYIARGNLEIAGSLTVDGEVHLILADKAKLTVKQGVILTEGNSLTIYVQSLGYDAGTLEVTGIEKDGFFSAGIGGYADQNTGERFSAGRLTINGGTIIATGAAYSAGIGGSKETDGGEVTINYGDITIRGGNGGAGIGGGWRGNGGNVRINGGFDRIYGGEGSAALGQKTDGFGSASAVRVDRWIQVNEIVDRPLSYDPSKTKEVLGDQLPVSGDGTVSVGTCRKVLFQAVTPSDGPEEPVIPIHPDFPHLHRGVLQSGVSPTNYASGYKEYYTCSCGKYFEDLACKTEIEDLDAWKSAGGRGYLAPLGGGGSSAPAPQVFGIPAVGKTDNAVKVEATVSGSTAAVRDISASEIAKAGTDAVSMDFSGLNKKVNAVSLPASTVKTLSGSEAGGLEIRLSTGNVKFDADAVDAISGAAGGRNIVLNVETVDGKALSDVQKNAVNGLENAVIVRVTLTSGGKSISGFAGGSAAVTVPYAKQDAGRLVEAYCLDADGTLIEMKAAYDAAVQSVTFTVPDFSEYVIAETDKLPFTDLREDAYYVDAVRWAAANGITTGTSDMTFSPNAPVRRGDVLTFLWRAAGEPEPESMNSFSDIDADAYYAKAAAWAAENGIADGVGNGKAAPKASCTRAEIVTFLWRFAGMPAADYAMSFEDVPSDKYYTEAVRWALAEKITDGTAAGAFSPKNDCTRVQVVTFLYRYFVK